MGAPGALIPAEVPSSQLQNYSFAASGCGEFAELPDNRHMMLDEGAGMPVVSSDLDRTSAVGGTQSEELVNVDSQPKLDERNEGNQTEKFEHDLGNLLQSLHISEASSAEKMQVKNVSKYVLSAAKNPEFAQKLHAVLLESGALPPPDLFSDVNPKYTGEDKSNEQTRPLNIVDDTVQSDQEKLLSSFEKSLRSFQGVCSASNARFCQSANWLDEQQKEPEKNDAIDVHKAHKIYEEQVLGSSLTKAVVSCKRQTRVGSVNDDGNGLTVKVGADSSYNELGNDSAILFSDTNNGDCILNDGKPDIVKSVLGEGTEWEIQWEDLDIGERIGIGKMEFLLHSSSCVFYISLP